MNFLTGYESAKERSRLSDAAGTVPRGDSLTVQADSKDADINVIMERYARTGQVPGLSRVPAFGDFSGISDYRSAIHAVRDADELFMQLPAKVRAKFENDAGAFMEFCLDPANKRELADLGVLKPEVANALRAEAEAEVKSQPTGGDRTRAAREAIGVAGRDDLAKRSGGARDDADSDRE